jgi:hypothetical protein
VKYIGFCAILAAALFFSGEYRKYINKRLFECESFLSFFAYIRLQLGCFLKPLRELAGDYQKRDGVLGRIVSELQSGIEPSAVYKKYEPELSLSTEEREVLRHLFSNLGKGYLEDEVKLLDSSCSVLGGLYASLKEEAPKKTKTVAVVSCALSLGFIILAV